MFTKETLKALADKISQHERNELDPVFTDGDKKYRDMCILRDMQNLIQARVNQSWKAGLYNV